MPDLAKTFAGYWHVSVPRGFKTLSGVGRLMTGRGRGRWLGPHAAWRPGPGVDQLARGELVGRHHHLRAGGLELLDAVVLDVLERHLDDAGLRARRGVRSWR